jgi:hypothetical protein
LREAGRGVNDNYGHWLSLFFLIKSKFEAHIESDCVIIVIKIVNDWKGVVVNDSFS